MIMFLAGVSITCNIFLLWAVKRLNDRLDTLYDYMAERELLEAGLNEEEEVVTWQSTN